MYNKTLIKKCNKMKKCRKMILTPPLKSIHIETTVDSYKTTATTKTRTQQKHNKFLTASPSVSSALSTRTSLLSTSSLLNFMPYGLLQIIIYLMLFLQLPACIMAGSCREAQLCCNGRDSSCVVQKAPINAIIEDLSDKPCYCDHACLKLGDCCTDFKDHCGVLDCQVSDWAQWSDCSTACGSGTMTRTRQVKQPAQNGGKHCPVLIQKRGCQGFHCHGHHDKKILRETALLLPASLTHHHINDSSVRRNLKAHYRETYQHNREQEYCVEFEVLRTSKACHKLPPYNLLIEGDRIVVRCDIEAFIQDFVNNNNLSANNFKIKHHNDTFLNKFEVINTSSEEDMNESEENMIDNSSGSSSSSSNSDEHDDYDTASLTILTTATTTTTTSTSTTTTNTPYPPPLPIQYHCRGEGLPGRTTRWSALAAPSCRGKWLRLTLDAPKKCTQPQFMFV